MHKIIMSKPLKKRKYSVIYKYVFLYIAIVSITIALILPVYFTAKKSTRSNILNELSVRFDSNCDDLNKSIENIMLLNINMISAQYSNSKTYQTPDISPTQLYNLISIQDFFKKLTNDINLPCNPCGFYIMYDNNEQVITDDDVCLSLKDFSSRVYYDKYDADEIHSIVTSVTDYYSFIPATPVSLRNDPQGNCLTVITKTAGNTSEICALYSEADLAHLFGIDALTDNAFFAVHNNSGQIIISHQFAENQDNHVVMRSELPSIGGYVLIGIPEIYLNAVSAPVEKVVTTYMIIALVIGILLAIGSAIYSYIPIHRLVMLPLADSSFKIGQGNEFVYIRTISEKLYNTNQKIYGALNSVERSFRSSLFTNLLFGATFTEDNRDVVLSTLPILSESCRIALVDVYELNNKLSDKVSAQIFEIFKKSDFLTLHTNPGKLAVLFSESAISEFTGMVHEINLLLSKYSISVATVISSLFVGPENVKTAYEQVHFAVASSDVEIYFCNPPEAGEQEIFDLQTIIKLTKKGDCSSLEEFLNITIFKFFEGKLNQTNSNRFYNLLRSALICIKADGKKDMSDIPLYRPENPVMDQFNHLCDLFLRYAAEKRHAFDAKFDYKRRLIKYIDENFSDPNIYAVLVAQKFGISTKQVYRIVHEATSMGFGEYLEQLRIRKASELLIDTKLSIKEISKACGFGASSSFFRNFKKYYNISPANYRRANVRV